MREQINTTKRQGDRVRKIKLTSVVYVDNPEAAEGFIEDELALVKKWGGSLLGGAWEEVEPEEAPV